MKLIAFAYKKSGRISWALQTDAVLYDLSYFNHRVPSTLDAALQIWPQVEPELERIKTELADGSIKSAKTVLFSEIELLPPTTNRCSFRDFYAFEQHVKTAHALRGLDVVEEWYTMPTFYFSNPNVFIADKGKVPYPTGSAEMDIELEVACIIGKCGKDIPLEEAANHIAGFTILNDFSARDLQRKEMRIGLGPAKGKDFANGLGPALITPRALATNKKGKGYNLEMKAYKNGRQISQGNWADIQYSFEEMIVHASRNVMLYPGDVLGSGTVGSGCILELRPQNTNGWLKKGDEIKLEIEALGTLTHYIY